MEKTFVKFSLASIRLLCLQLLTIKMGVAFVCIVFIFHSVSSTPYRNTTAVVQLWEANTSYPVFAKKFEGPFKALRHAFSPHDTEQTLILSHNKQFIRNTRFGSKRSQEFFHPSNSENFFIRKNEGAVATQFFPCRKSTKKYYQINQKV